MCPHPVVNCVLTQTKIVRNLQKLNSPFYTYLNLMCVHRTDFGPEDGDREEGGTAVFHEDVHGLTALVHLPHEVCEPM